MICTKCQKREATPGYRKCDHCREQNRRAQRACYRRNRRLHPESTRERALRMLSMFVLTPRELADALHISVSHAGVTLQRLHQRGRCHRFVSGKLPDGKPALRYRLRD